MNRLAHERSPYLLQHAHNPVDWFAWGDEAFAKARADDKPIFLSIGYSTCHWCHVMEHESFENEAVSAVLNEHFVAIKVDREERPDIDRVYMTFVQATTGSGGWPMSVWLTPELKPFYGGTYYPPKDAYGRPGFPTLLEAIARTWREKRADVIASSEQVVERLRELGASARSAEALDADVLASGGMYDHLGGGFHRYSVDRVWHVPHFEKMLYDQAQLVDAYVEAWQATGEASFLRVARETCAYVLRDLTDPATGGFWSAEDAD